MHAMCPSCNRTSSNIMMLMAAALLGPVAIGVGAFQPSRRVLGYPTLLRPIQSLNSAVVGSADENSKASPAPDACSIMVGTSPKAIKLRKQVQAIWNDPDNTAPIILHGPRGSGKGELAEEIASRLPSWQTRNVHRLSLDDSLDFIDTVLGTHSHPGLLDDLSGQANTTLILKGFQSLNVESRESYDRREELVHALTDLIQRRYYSTFENETKPFLPRIIGCTQRDPDYFKRGLDDGTVDTIFIKVPSFESRTKDLKDISVCKIREIEQSLGMIDVKLSKEATQRLLDHSWAIDADAELDTELFDALKLLASERNWNPFAYNTLEPRHLLINANNEKIRNRLLYNVPFLRQAIMSPWIFGKTLKYIVPPIFVVINLILWLGPQARNENAVLTIFWAGWWPGIMLVFPFLGRIWCTICPFMAFGNLAQDAALAMDVQLRKWPKWGQTAGPAFAFGLFYAILMWEELWDLPQNGVLSSCLLLLITAGAVINSVIFEKRLWCRFLCPIGAMNKIFATAAMTEVRTWKANCDGCTTTSCKKGGSVALDPDDAYAIKGCTMDLKNNQLRDMGDCVMCMSCVKNCEREAPEFNVRPLGQDYGLPWFLPKQLQKPEFLAPSQVETNFWLGGILTILQGGVALHYLPKILTDVGLDPTIAAAPPAFDLPFAQHAALAAVILAFPGTLSYAADAAAAPLESLVNVFRRELTRRPAENYAIVKLYESLVAQDTDLAETMKEFDVDGDGVVADWELKEAFQRLGIPRPQHELLQNVLTQEGGEISVSTLFDEIQELYFDIKETEQPSRPTYRSVKAENELQTQLTFVEIFNRLDRNGNGFISKEEFATMSDQGYFKRPLTEQQSNALFDKADVLGLGRLNLFEFMSILRKTVKVGIQEIGYGYLPLAWGSLTSYWLGLGMRELGLSLARLPETFYLPFSEEMKSGLPQFVADWGTIHAVQFVVMVTSFACTISLTQKLCDDNRIGPVRFGAHAAVQTIGTALILYLMLSPELPISAYR
ncbi:hypothetical protein ACHAXT_007508 [Thalassiosira profunda]